VRAPLLEHGSPRGWPPHANQQPWTARSFSPAATVVQPALVWGGTFGFGWAAVRQTLTGQLLWVETLAVSTLAVLVCAGSFYLKRAWEERRQRG
jgi:protein-S-isoprenylcysteine O-methyltransferase Ste14